MSPDSDKRRNTEPNKKPRFLTHLRIGLPIPRTDAPLTLKLAKKIPKKQALEEKF